MEDRQTHLEWCKQRALETLRHSTPVLALASMISDLKKHPETEDHAGIMLGMALLAGGDRMRDDEHEMRKFIEGFR